MKTKQKVVNVELNEALSLFRNQFPLKSLMYQQTEWKYYAGGSGNDTVIILPGGLATGEAAFLYLLELGKNHKVISPVYPHLDSMDELAEGISEIIEVEKAGHITLFGVSFGGLLAQCFMKKDAKKVTNLILAHTATNLLNYEDDDTQHTVGNLRKGIGLIRKLPSFMVRFMLKRKYQKLAKRLGDESLFWKHYLVKIAQNSTKESVLSSFESMLDFALNQKFSLDYLKEWTGRILILEADDDASFTDRQKMMLKALYANATVNTQHGYGHLTTFIRRDEYIRLIENFIAKK